ncbi:MAG TPA: hypothetical protein VGD17_19255 [Chitinophagaceae bacterium]
MRSHFILLLFLSISLTANAQIDKLPKTNPSSSVNAGKLLTQFANAIKPSALTNEGTSQKGSWISKAQKVSDAVSFASSVSSLAGLVKPGMFKQGINAQTILQTANTVKTMSDAAGLLKTFEGGLKPEALLSSWSKQRGGWLSALNLFK